MSDVLMFEELIKSSPFAIIELFELHLDQAIHGSNEIFRFYNGVVVQTQTGEIIYQGKQYLAIPVEAEGFEYTAGQAGFPRPTLRVGNLFSIVSALMVNVNETTFGNDLTGAKVVRIRTLSRFLDEVNFDNDKNPYGTPFGEQMPQEIYFVNRKVVESRDVVEFELAAKLDLENVKAPRRQCLANVCQWVYRSAECGYTGTNYFDENDNAINGTPATNFSYNSGDEILASGESLTAGQFLTSSNGWYRAQFGSNGNFFVYSKANDPSNITNVLWQIPTSQRGGTSVNMGANGDLYISDGSKTIWQSHSSFNGTPSTVRFDGYIPEDGAPGRHASFYHEIFGNADDYNSTVRNATKEFTLDDGRTIELQFTAASILLSADSPARVLGVNRRWENPTDTFTAPATVVSTTGQFYQNETIRVTIKTDDDGADRNPWAHRIDGLGVTFPTVGAIYTMTGITDNYNGATLVLQPNGNLQVIDTNSTPLWQSYKSESSEPLVQTGTVNALQDVCGKRVSSCKKRFGNTAELPFGSFPGVGASYE